MEKKWDNYELRRVFFIAVMPESSNQSFVSFLFETVTFNLGFAW